MEVREWWYAPDRNPRTAVGSTFKVLGSPRRYVEDAGTPDITVTWVYRCIAPRYMSEREVMRAIHRAHDSGPCGHSHDCCGCWHYYAYDVKKAGKRGAYSFKVNGARNY